MTPTKLSRSFLTVLALGALASTTFGCIVDELEAPPPAPAGDLVQKWTIEGSTEPKKCVANGAARMRLVVIDSAGNVDATELAPCSAFQVGQRLLVDDYTATATFLSPNGFPVSQTLAIPRFSIRADQTTTQTIDFPASTLQPPR